MKLAIKQIILHCRTKNLPTKEELKSIANNIINLAKNIKTNKFGDLLSRSLNNKYNVVVRSLGGAKTHCMEDYIKPTMKLAIKQKILYYRYTTKIRYSNTLPRLQFLVLYQE